MRTRISENSRVAFFRENCNLLFVVDKFHIIKLLMESFQDVRVGLRQDLLRERRSKYDAHKKREKEWKKQCMDNGMEYNKQPFRYEEDERSNGETNLKILARGRYLLFKYPDDWTAKQKQRAYTLFEKYPEIKSAYEIL